MRSRYLIICVTLMVSAAFSAEGETASDQAVGAHIMRGTSVTPTVVAAWETKVGKDGRIQISEGKDAAAKAPANAVHYESKIYTFPTGTIRVLSYRKGNGGLLYPITAETEIYVIKGTFEVAVAGVPTEIDAGDAVNRPGGTLRSKGADQDAAIVLYTVGSSVKDSKSVVIRGKDVPDTQLAQWIRDGHTIASKTPAEFAQAPADAQIHLTKRYDFDGNSIRVPFWKKGDATIVGGPVLPTENALLYIWQGEGRFTYGGKEDEIFAGDAIDERAAVTHSWVLVRDMKFTATDAPRKVTP